MASTEDTFSPEERAAMKARARETRPTGGAAARRAAAEFAAAIDALPDDEAAIARRPATIVSDVAPVLATRTWYGMPAWTLEGKVVCYFKPATKFKQRYSTFGFEEAARLDHGTMWQTCWALTALDDRDAATVADLVKRAVTGA